MPNVAPVTARELTVLRQLAKGGRLVRVRDTNRFRVRFADAERYASSAVQSTTVDHMLAARRIVLHTHEDASAGYVITGIGLDLVAQHAPRVRR